MRYEAWPSLVEGVYAPPANLYPHFLQFQMPTLTRLTDGLAQLGHLWAALAVAIILL